MIFGRRSVANQGPQHPTHDEEDVAVGGGNEADVEEDHGPALSMAESNRIECESVDENENEDVNMDEEVNSEHPSKKKTNNKTFLGDNFHGSRRNLRKKAQNSLALVSEFGRPTVMITLTANPEWSEIVELLPQGQSAFDRPDIVDLVFKARLEAILHNIRHGHYFGDGNEKGSGKKRIVELHVIEYQERGMPHAHIIVKLDSDLLLDFLNKENLKRWVDLNISACLPPDPKEMENPTESDKRYFVLVRTHMVHKHVHKDAVNTCFNEKTKKCKKGFDETFVCCWTTFDKRGFPHYKRLRDKDLMVVQHNRQILLDWDGHACIDFAMNTHCVMYMYKYAYKGAKKVRMQLKNADDIGAKDEIALYLRGRKLCSMDAMWRAYQFQTYPAPYPRVQAIKTRLPSFVESFRADGKLVPVDAYFARPNTPDFVDLKFTDFYQKYVIARKQPASHRSFVELLMGFEKPVFIVKRSDDEQHKSITRMEMLFPMSGDIFYLRLILLNRAVNSFEDAYSWNGIKYGSFQQAAVASGVTQEDKEAHECMIEAVTSSTPAELRSLFVILTINGFPTLNCLLDVDIKHPMMDDYLVQLQDRNESIAFNTMLQDLCRRFQREGKEMSDYGLPMPEETETELDRERVKFPVQSQIDELSRLNSRFPNNVEQQEVFDLIMSSVKSQSKASPGRIFMIQASAGCGKTNVALKLCAASRAEGKIVKGCCSNGLACSNYPGDFETAHALFLLPVIEEEDKEVDQEPMISGIRFKPERKELLENTDVFIWDEFFSNHRECFEAVYKELNGFVGKTVVVIGDFKQILPVVKNGTKDDILNATICSSSLWHHFQKCFLKVNMRLINLDPSDPDSEAQIQYQGLLNDVGFGAYNSHYAQVIDESDCGSKRLTMLTGVKAFETPIPIVPVTDVPLQTASMPRLTPLPIAPIPTSVDTFDDSEMLRWLYPNGFDHNAATGSTILAGSNKRVDDWNDRISGMNGESELTLFSRDHLCEVDDSFHYLEGMVTTEVLNDFTKNSVPPHILKLKKNDICFITRNLSITDGLANNTRVQILNISRYNIRVLTVSDTPMQANIPRIRFKFRLPYGHSFEMMRVQFPLRRAYAMTFNKCQGQTLKKCLLDLREDVFGHGQLYVALSRVRHFRDIALIVYENLNFHYPDIPFSPVVWNLVYGEALRFCND